MSCAVCRQAARRRRLLLRGLRPPAAAAAPSSSWTTPAAAADAAAAADPGEEEDLAAQYRAKWAHRLDKFSEQSVSYLARKKAEHRPVHIFDGMTLGEASAACKVPAEYMLSLLSDEDGMKFMKEGLDTTSLIDLFTKLDIRYRIVRKLLPPEPYQPQPEEQPIDLSGRKLTPRPPIVTILGHVDHGKTTLLDYLRKTQVAAGEAGGITQRIGAFSVTLGSGKVTFIDTPGHAAFGAMRERGTQMTDLVVLIVAADDGVMQQTVQCIHFIRQFNVPFIVAITKTDKPNADVEFVEYQLQEFDISIEKLGGDVPCVAVSALKTGQGVQDLVEAVESYAEMLELKSDKTCRTEGVVVESRVSEKYGNLATLIVKTGTLSKGQILLCKDAYCKVLSMFDENGEKVKKAEPGTAVEVMGWKSLPNPGDYLVNIPSEKRARQIVSLRHKYKDDLKAYEAALESERLLAAEREEYEQERLNFAGNRHQLRTIRILKSLTQKQNFKRRVPQKATVNLMVRADVQGSLEALLDILETFSSHLCDLNILSSSVGQVTQKDVELAKFLPAKIIAFNTDLQPGVEMPEAGEGGRSVEMIREPVIYKLMDRLKDSVTAELPQVETEDEVGRAEVLKLIKVSGKDALPVAGCRVKSGQLNRAMMFKLERDGEDICDLKLDTLKHFKNSVSTLSVGKECGISFEELETDLEPGDQIVCYQIKMIPGTLEWDPKF